uniref:ethanolamine kinase n=1 Tax=Chlamydomonas asymmetrica TaxID=51683 RepID=A0A125SQH4_9CHLO|nr:ethanolamine kinase [Chlamydomonas asymmetrica]
MTAPPTDPVSISFADGIEAGEREAVAVCQRILPGWSQLDGGLCTVSKISGGISNMLVKVAPPADSGLNPVAVKVFGDKTELLIDRDTERHVLLKLNEAGFGAKVVGLFENGRIEEFLPCKTLTPDEMASPDYVPRIAARLRKFHELKGLEQQSQPRQTQFDTIRGWLAMARSLHFDDPAKQKQYAAVDFGAMEKELQELEDLCQLVDSPVVFSHNDLLSGNILILQPPQGTGRAEGAAGKADNQQDDAGQDMQFIDFEYSAYGFRGFDFGNHFNEYAGFDCDYTKYPGPAAQRLFFRHYLGLPDASSNAQPPTTANHQNQDTQPVSAAHQDQDQDHQDQDQDQEDQQLERLSAEANIYALASHAYWGVWSFIQARYSPIDFDYLSYSALRWGEYHRRKEEFVAQLKRVFGAAAGAP